MNIFNYLNITTKEFIKNYVNLKVDEDHILRCILKKDPKCIFNKNNLCIIHELRPLRCRTFPIGRYFKDNEVHYLFPQKECMGFQSNKKQTIEEWFEENNVTQYNKLSEDWNNFIIKLKNENYPLNNPQFLTMFTKIFYDFDNELIQKYKKDMQLDSKEEFIQLLYQIAEETLLKVNLS